MWFPHAVRKPQKRFVCSFLPLLICSQTCHTNTLDFDKNNVTKATPTFLCYGTVTTRELMVVDARKQTNNNRWLTVTAGNCFNDTIDSTGVLPTIYRYEHLGQQNDSPLTPTRIIVCLGSDPSPAWFGSGAGLVRIRMSVVRIPIPKSQSQAQAIGDGHKPDAPQAKQDIDS